MDDGEISPFGVATERLPSHLEERYGISVASVAGLDVGVLRVERRDGPSWVARVFAARRPIEAVEGDARILRALESARFPAERCAHAEPTSTLEGQGVLVTEYVDGRRAASGGRTFAVLGALLGLLHQHSGANTRPGGGWHHLAPQGTPGDEIAAAAAWLDERRPRVLGTQLARHDRLRAELELADDGADLPQAFVHPDFVPVNAVAAADGGLVIVDWTGAGRGPRAWSLGWLLFAAGARDLRLVDAALARYRAHIALEPRELARLAGAIRARALTIDCWSLCVGRLTLADVLDRAAATAGLARSIAQRAQRALEAEGPAATG